MKGLVFLFVEMVIFVVFLTFIIHFLPSRIPNSDKSSPYECGFDPLKSARVPFSFRFFLVAMLFLIFDLEMALLFPLPSAIIKILGQFLLLLMSFCFIIVLTLGLIYEWVKGGLEWAILNKNYEIFVI